MTGRFRSIKIIDVFIICSLFGLLFCIAYWIRIPEGVNHSVMDPDFEFSDFFLHVEYSRLGSQVYHESYFACFPPLAYCFYYFIWTINRLKQPVDDWEVLRFTNQFPLIFVMYNVILCIAILACVWRYLDRESERKRLLIGLLVITSYPFFGSALQRGNSVAIVAVLLCIACYWKESETAWKREIALILIAVSCGFKIYPAFFGILYLYERRWKEAFRLVIYGALLFFVPFIFFGGIDGFKAFLGLMLQREDRYVTYFITVRGFVCSLLPKNVPQETATLIGKVAENVVLLLCVWAGYVSGKNWRRMFFVCLVLVVYIPVNNIYTLVYLLPACLAFLREEGDKSLRRSEMRFAERDIGEAADSAGIWTRFTIIVCTVMFGIIFSMPSWQNYIFSRLVILHLALLVGSVVLLGDTVRCAVISVGSSKNAKKF